MIGIDYGDARTGMAKVDTACPIVTPLETIKDRSVESTAAKAAEMICAQNAGRVVIGLPKNMDGSLGFRAEKVQLFADLLREKISCEIVFSDERLTSCYAHTVMNMTDTRGKKRKEEVDALAATIILQNYVDSLSSRPL